ISVLPKLDLYDRDWPILTHQEQTPPAKFVFDNPDRRGEAIESMVSGGCIVSGARVRKSLIFTNCKLHSHAVIENSLILPECEIEDHCIVRNAIIDRGVLLPEGTQVGVNLDDDRARGFRVTEAGRTLVTPAMLNQKLHHTR
ncbi:MAG: glucose-1-phosphate adenylyltransferase, partial [Xanthomonadales bacterium]|nr:glucose-1-phosphate adenylyltransferase [Xanthomonadales bacterium]